MTTVQNPEAQTRGPLEELADWLENNWDPDLSVGDWWDRLGMSGWAAPILPADCYGRGLTQGDAIAVQRVIVEFGALPGPVGLGLMLAAPTIATHGSRDQIDRYIPEIVTGRRAWCQLFSEPGAGSDLAGLSTRAVRDGDGWVINGQKVWTSGGHMSDLGMLLARTNPEVPKHKGITWFALDMHQSGVEVRPLREMTGSTRFSEVFMTDARVDETERIGDIDGGWGVANTTLLYERTGMGAGGSGPSRGAGIVTPGTVAGNLSRRAGDFVRSRPSSGAGAKKPRSSVAQSFIALAQQLGRAADPSIREKLVRLHTLGELSRLNTERSKAARNAGRDIPGMANLSKLMMADTLRLSRDLGLQILGSRGMLHAYNKEGRAVLDETPGCAGIGLVTSAALNAQALPIFGGTDQIQKNIIAERALGLPKDPVDVNDVPFSQLRKNG